METKKAFVRPDNTVTITCPQCQATRTVSLDRLPPGKHLVKIKCACATIFPVRLEFRKNFRKQTSLPGRYQLLTPATKDQPRPETTRGKTRYSAEQEAHSNGCTVKNLSMTGVGLLIPGNHGLKVGDILGLEFALDDRRGSEFNKKVVVRLVTDSFVGCQFIDTREYDKALGFYLR
ncbi:MAG: PilZ domain-containing protein [Desulfobacterales bacterium]|nr:PilZ domain-containing protein [Desulfobacterales bacterium]